MKLTLLKRTIAVGSALSLVLSASAVAANAAEIEEFGAGAAQTASVADQEDPIELPQSYSSLDLGYVTGIKSQEYSDCWAYATLSTLETKLLKEGYTNVDMSETHLNGWATKHSNDKGWQRTIFEDGYQNTGLGYLLSWQGGILLEDAGNLDLYEMTSSDSFTGFAPRYGVIAAEQFSGSDPQSIKRAIYENGSVDSAFGFAKYCLNANNGAYYMNPDFSGTFSGHAVQIIGWDDNYSVENFKNSPRPTNPGAWLIKNSWGTSAGSGYLWISYEDKYLLGTKYKPSFAIKSVMPINENVKLLQNEIYGSTYEFSYVKQDDVTYLNRFDFEEDFRTIDKVIFKSECLGGTYTIYYVPDNNNAPDADESTWQRLYTGTIDYMGYICADIEDEKLPAGKGSIAVRIDSSEVSQQSGNYSSIGVGEWLTASGKYVFLNDSRYGESYIYYDNTMSDLLDWYSDVNNDQLGGTFAIKAVVNKNAPEPIMGDIDLDGELTINDATLLQFYLAELETLSDEALAVADIDNDGYIDINDATTIQKILVGLI